MINHISDFYCIFFADFSNSLKKQTRCNFFLPTKYGLTHGVWSGSFIIMNFLRIANRRFRKGKDSRRWVSNKMIWKIPLLPPPPPLPAILESCTAKSYHVPIGAWKFPILRFHILIQNCICLRRRVWVKINPGGQIDASFNGHNTLPRSKRLGWFFLEW